MTLATSDLLVAVIAARASHFTGLDRLRVDDSGAGSFVSALGFADLAPQGIDQLLPGALLLPGDEVVPDGALGKQIMRQEIPLAARAGLVEQGVDYLAEINLAWPASRLGRRKQRLNHLPLS